MSLLRAVFYISVYFLVFNNASDIQKIQIRGPNPAFASHTVLEHEPLQITLENFTTVSRCTYKDYEDYRTSYNNYFKTGHFTIIIPEVIASMSTRWRCEMVVFNNTDINYSFDVRVVGAKTVDVKIGGVLQYFKKVNLTVLEYDGIAERKFEEGDVVDLTCGNRYRTGRIRMRYYGGNGTLLFEAHDTGINYPLTFRILIKNKSINQTYVECTYIEPTTLHEFTYRTILTVLANENIRSSNVFIVTVNGMELTPFSRKVHGRDRYLYYYVVGESAQLTCAKKNQLMLGDIHGRISNDNTNKVVTRDILNTPSMYSISFETKHLNGMIFQCYSTTESSYITVDIMFFKEHAQDPIILGLSASNILYQYNTGDNEWITYYQYSTKQELNLTCITTVDRKPQWIYRDNIITSVVNENNEFNTSSIYYVFNMDVESDETIICTSTKSGTITKKMIIIFKDDETNEGSSIAFVVSGIVVGVLGALIIGFLMLYCTRLKWNGTQKV